MDACGTSALEGGTPEDAGGAVDGGGGGAKVMAALSRADIEPGKSDTRLLRL
jgi:hypothetical protein